MDENLPEHMALISDFTEWQINNPKKIMTSGQSVTEDGRLVFNLSINDTKFRLLCPANYPNHEDSFFMETECTDFWCIALNEFIIDSPEKLTLDVILRKTFLYYTPASKKSHDNSENESDNENENENECELLECSTGESDSSETDEWESIICKKKREWKAKEGELRLRYNRPKISDMFDGKIMDHPQQVFSNSAASEILINDLINIMGSKDSNGIVVDPVENDTCRWSVFLKDFHPHSKISLDLKETKELYGYDYVQLQLNFTMDLYPAHPPIIQVVRPKLIGVFDTEDFVKLANWNPARDMMSVLKEIKDHIDHNGRIDINNKSNGIKIGIVNKILLELGDVLKGEPKSDLCYTEKFLIAATEDSPSLEGNNAVIEMILTTLLYYFRNSECEETSVTKSTSLSTDMKSFFTFSLALNNNVFDVKNYEVTMSETSSYSSSMFKAIDQLVENEKLDTQNRYENQQKVDMLCEKKHCNIITNPAFGLGFQSQNSTGLQNEKYSINNVSIHETNGASSYSNRNNKNNVNGSEQRNKTNNGYVNDGVVSSFNVNIKTLKELSKTASSISTLEPNDNFSCMFKTLEESVLLPFIRSKLAVDAFFRIWLTMSLYSKIIEILIEFASNPYLIDLLAISEIPGQSISDLLKILEENVTLILEKLAVIADGHLMKQADLNKAELARSIIDTSKLLQSQLTKYCNRNPTDKIFSISKNRILNSDFNHYQVESLDSDYEDSLKDLKFRNCDIDVETHTFKNEYIADMNSSRNYFRIAQEFAVLSKSLPLELTSAIFVRMDNSKPSLMRALVTGAEDTCCSGGCFSFDIYLRKDYPDGGLEISCTTFCNEETTWHPKDRNFFLLYGKDVLNLVPKSQNNISNILQVLTYIQYQKLIPLEVYDENRKREDLEESGSDEIILKNVIQYAMINQMRKPTPGFEEVIATHFRIKKDRIISELEQYDFLKNSVLLDSLKKEFDLLTCSNQKT